MTRSSSSENGSPNSSGRYISVFTTPSGSRAGALADLLEDRRLVGRVAAVDDVEPHREHLVRAVEPAQTLADRGGDRLLEDLVLGEPRRLQRVDVGVDDGVRALVHLAQVAAIASGAGGAAATVARN